MSFALGLIIGAVAVFALMMIIGSIEWEESWTVEKDDSHEDERRS